MNGLQITGMKMSSPAPNKKTPIHKPSTVVKKNTNKPVTQKPIIKNQKKKQEKYNKEEVKKIEEKVVKQESLKEEEIKKQEEVQKQEEKVEVKVQSTIEEQKVQIPDFEVTLRYNHYKDKFPCKNGVVCFDAPNQKYSFGLVFMGNYQPKLRHFKTRQIIQPLTTGTAPEFSWKVEEGDTYQIQIDEDEEQQSKRERHAYKAPQKPKCSLKKNGQAQLLTQQMKGMDVSQLGSAKHRQMLEQRDLEEILYS